MSQPLSTWISFRSARLHLPGVVLSLTICLAVLLLAFGLAGRDAAEGAVQIQAMAVHSERADAAEIEDAGALPAADGFREVAPGVPNLGIGGTHWLRIEIANRSSDTVAAIVSLRFPYLEQVTLYALDERARLLGRAGTALQPGGAAVPSLYPSFAVTLPPSQATTYYARIASSTLILAPVQVETSEEFGRQTAREHLVYGLLVGVMLACAAYVLTFSMALREPSYAAFTMLALASAAYVVTVSGLGRAWLWPDLQGATSAIYFGIQGLLFASAAWFFRSFLSVPRAPTGSDLLLRALAWCGGISALSPLMPGPIAGFANAFCAVGGPVALFLVLLRDALRGHRAAQIAAIGWSASLGASVYLYLRIFDLTPYLAINPYIAPLSTTFAVVYFAWALALRLRETEYLSLHDPMTGLANRRYLNTVLSERSAHCRRWGKGLAVLQIDLDGFKPLNDAYGHDVGDRALTHIARKLRGSIRSHDFVARTGGDEFVVLCSSMGEREPLARLAQRLIQVVNEPFACDGRTMRVGMSVGISFAMGDGVDGERLIGEADAALYTAKGKGRNRHEFYSADHAEQFQERRHDSTALGRALEMGELTCVYQPVVDSRTMRIASAEALLRWNHPERGLIGPQDFLKDAANQGLTGLLDEHVLSLVIRDMAWFDGLGASVPSFSVNVGLDRLADPDLLDSLKQVAFPRDRIAFELLETAFLDHVDPTIARNLAGLKDLGIALDIDDFGTGHASILSVIRIQPRRLKIDRSFVARLGPEQENQRLIQAIVEIGRSLGVGIVAEGVETGEQARLLRDLGCDALQGFFIARPMTREALRDFVTAPRLRRVS